jgi:hypothetical protein
MQQTAETGFIATIPGNICLHTSRSASHPKRTTTPINTAPALPMLEINCIRENDSFSYAQAIRVSESVWMSRKLKKH